jgi:hypothetical protein
MEKLQTLVITLVVIGLLLGIGILLMTSFMTQMATEVVTVNNESANTNQGLIRYMTHNWTTSTDCGYNSFNVIYAQNGTAGAYINSVNYTINTNKGWINLTSRDTFTNGTLNVTYTYQRGPEGCTGIETARTALGIIPEWLVIMVIIFITGIILAFVFKSLGKSGAEFGSSEGSFERIGTGGSDGYSGETTAEI